MNRLVTAVVAMLAFGQSSAAGAMPADHLTTTEYGKIGGWTLRAAKSPSGRVEICDAYIITGSERALRFEIRGDAFVVAFNGLYSMASEQPMKVDIWFDDRRVEAERYEMALVADATDYTWRGLSRTDRDGPSGFMDMFTNLSTIHFAYTVPGSGRHVETFPLKGADQVSRRPPPACTGVRPVPSDAGRGAPLVAERFRKHG